MKAVQRVTKALLTARVDEALAALEGASKAGVGGMTAASSAESSLAQVDATIDAVIVLLRGMGLAFGNNGLKSLYTVITNHKIARTKKENHHTIIMRIIITIIIIILKINK
ncbi:hypothetical protein T492DRAFT_85654 [Pavlovales sp. CCMP2436]|nr:hypothetical protein T492DRAFT_85654 [Pavlovales sp. CCMP2436]